MKQITAPIIAFIVGFVGFTIIFRSCDKPQHDNEAIEVKTIEEQIIKAYAIGWMDGVSSVKELQSKGIDNYEHILMELSKDSLNFAKQIIK